MKVTILGCGASSGIPIIGCRCAVCQSPNPKNKRLRASILIEQGNTRLLVDMSPDLRHQALMHQITQVDAICITHAHADHTHGIDDVRPFNYMKDQPLPVYATRETFDRVKQQFSYCFQPPIPEFGWFRPALEAHEVELNGKAFQVSDEMAVTPFLQIHGKMPCMGIKVGNFAYSTDVNNLPEESLQTLENIEIWVVDCLRYSVAPTHAHLDMTLEWIARVKPKRAILTHMAHEMDYESLKSRLPAHVEPAYDGMVIHCN